MAHNVLTPIISLPVVRNSRLIDKPILPPVFTITLHFLTPLKLVIKPSVFQNYALFLFPSVKLIALNIL